MIAEQDVCSPPETKVAQTSTSPSPQHIILTPVEPSSLGTTLSLASPSLPVVVVPRLAIPAEAYPE